MASPVRSELPGWLSSASVAWLGALMAVLVLSVAGAFSLYEQREIEERELHNGEMLARVLEDHGNRTFNTIDATLSALAEGLRSGLRTTDPIRFGPALRHTQQGMPFVRSLSLIDASGRVLASSADENVDVVLDLNRVPLPVAGAIDRLGSLVPGRDLADASAATAAASQASRRSFIPLVRAAFEGPEAPLYLVAALNPDYFANEYQLTLADPNRAAALFSTDGLLLSGTDNLHLAPGRSAKAHRFFAEYMIDVESGSFIGPGIDGAPVITAFRSLRHRPLSVVVERSYASVQVELARVSAWVAAACAMTLAVIGVLVGMAWRSLRSHEAVQDALEASRERVERSESDLRTLVEAVHEVIFRADRQGNLTFLNERWQQISGRPAAAALGQPLASLCLPADRARAQALFEPGDSATPHTALLQIEPSQGELRTLEVSVAAVPAHDGSPAGFAGLAVDVSERLLARRTLQSQLDFTALLIEVSPTPLFVKDGQGRFVTVNQAWLELMALTREQVIGRRSSDLFGTDAPKHSAFDERLFLSEERISYENRLLRPDGQQRDTVVTKVRFNQADGRSAGIIGSIIDVTTFREAERSIAEARDAAQRANQVKSEFIASISHELRTPLQAIIGFSELGAELAEAQPAFNELFGDIHAGGRRMLALVNDLLDVAKMENLVGSLALQRCDLAALGAEVVRELRPLAARRELTMDLCQRLEPMPVNVDGLRIQQVLRNVLANAMRFAPSGSAIEIACRSDAETGIDITVRDHGPGIPVDELETIFDAFVQSSRTRDGSGGTGLGLTICRRIMSAHGGTIEAANADDGGALMRIHLPPGVRADASLPDPVPQIEFQPAPLAMEAL